MPGHYVRVGIIQGAHVRDGVSVPCQTYVVSVSGATLASSEVYEQDGPVYLPLRRAIRLPGTFAELHGGLLSRVLPEWESLSMEFVFNVIYPQSEIYWYFRSSDGGVDVFVRPWPRPRSMSALVHYSVTDISDPVDWHLACCYRYVGAVIRPDWASSAFAGPGGGRSSL